MAVEKQPGELTEKLRAEENLSEELQTQKPQPKNLKCSETPEEKCQTDDEKYKAKAKELEANQSSAESAKMAIDLPETIPSIINTFKRSNSAKTLQKFTKNLKSCDKTSKWSFFKPKGHKHGPCHCSFPDCKECKIRLSGSNKAYSENECCAKKSYVRSNKNFQSNNDDTDQDCEQTLLGEVDLKPDLSGKLPDWKLRDNEGDIFSNKYWKTEKKANKKYYGKRRDDETLLDASNELRKHRRKVFFLSALGLALLSTAIFIRLADPVEAILNWKLTLAPNSMVLDLWVAPPVTVYVKIYIFNITNPVEFLEKKEKLRVEEIGPYVFTEHLENTNPIFNSNGTLSYIPRRTVKPVPELSVNDPKYANVIVPNIPLLGLASMVSERSMVTNFAYITLTKYLGSQPFLNLSVYDYLWGYNDPLVKVANKVVASWIPFERFGIMDRMYDEGDNVITMRLSDNGLNVTDKGYLPQYTIDNWNGSPGLKHWGYRSEDYEGRNPMRPEPEDRCKLIRGATDGVIFPRNMDPRLELQVYRKTFCRIMPIKFDREGVLDNGIPGYWYKIPEDVFDPPESNPSQACYCNPNVTKCLPKGLSDLTPCYYSIPAAVSFPHFLGGDPKLVSDIDGIKPDKIKHGTKIVLQPNLGMPIEFETRIQTNLVMSKIKYNAKVVPFSELTIPLFWVDLSMDQLPSRIIALLYLVIFVVPILQTALMILGFAVGSGLLIYSILCWLIQKGWIEIGRFSKKKYVPVKISPVVNKSHIVNLSRRNSVISAINSRKSSVISNHKMFINEI